MQTVIKRRRTVQAFTDVFTIGATHTRSQARSYEELRYRFRQAQRLTELRSAEYDAFQTEEAAELLNSAWDDEMDLFQQLLNEYGHA